MSVYAIKVWLSKSEKDWFLYKDLEDNVVHTWSRKEKAEWKCIGEARCPRSVGDKEF